MAWTGPAVVAAAAAVKTSFPLGKPLVSSTSFLEHFLHLPRPLSCPKLPPCPKASSIDYTLILDLDETLLHTEWIQGSPERYVVHERPFVREFLRALKRLPVEVIIFTAGVQGYADTVIDIMDQTTQTVGYRLYRQHTTSCGVLRWKDLSLLNRDLSKTIIVDNSPEVFRRQPDNGVPIASWEGHLSIGTGTHERKFFTVDDFALINLFYWLEYLCTTKQTVPDFICTYRNALRAAVGYSDKSKAPANYTPPFSIGPISIDLVKRCTQGIIPPSHSCPENDIWGRGQSNSLMVNYRQLQDITIPPSPDICDKTMRGYNFTPSLNKKLSSIDQSSSQNTSITEDKVLLETNQLNKETAHVIQSSLMTSRRESNNYISSPKDNCQLFLQQENHNSYKTELLNGSLTTRGINENCWAVATLPIFTPRRGISNSPLVYHPNSACDNNKQINVKSSSLLQSPQLFPLYNGKQIQEQFSCLNATPSIITHHTVLDEMEHHTPRFSTIRRPGSRTTACV